MNKEKELHNDKRRNVCVCGHTRNDHDKEAYFACKECLCAGYDVDLDPPYCRTCGMPNDIFDYEEIEE